MLSHAGLNATLNAVSACLLSAGYFCVRTGRILAHKTCMILAFTSSTIFLVSYVIYHVRVGSVHFQGQGWIRPVYFTLLGTHTILAIVIVPMVILTLSRALREKCFGCHSERSPPQADESRNPSAFCASREGNFRGWKSFDDQSQSSRFR